MFLKEIFSFYLTPLLTWLLVLYVLTNVLPNPSIIFKDEGQMVFTCFCLKPFAETIFTDTSVLFCSFKFKISTWKKIKGFAWLKLFPEIQ